jgi:hypothetical protein
MIWRMQRTSRTLTIKCTQSECREEVASTVSINLPNPNARVLSTTYATATRLNTSTGSVHKFCSAAGQLWWGKPSSPHNLFTLVSVHRIIHPSKWDYTYISNVFAVDTRAWKMLEIFKRREIGD